MRIIAGSHRGRLLVAPKGQSTRPTTDRAREALFNVLEHADWAPLFTEARVLDLFAGSGALGFEAVSRGAAHCLFVDRDSAAVAAVIENAAALQLENAIDVSRRDATRLGARTPSIAPFHIAFLDAPYERDLTAPALKVLSHGEWLAPGGVAVAEIGLKETSPEVANFELLDQRTWGAARVLFFRAS